MKQNIQFLFVLNVMACGSRDSTIPGEQIVPQSEWNAAPSLQSARFNHTATLLLDGRVLVVGGESTAGVALDTVEIYDPTSQVWTQLGSLSEPRANHSATLLESGEVLVAGGGPSNSSNWPSGNVLASALLFHPATEQWTSTGDLGTARSHHLAFVLENGDVLLAGGAGGTLDPSAAFADCLDSSEIYEVSTGTFRPTGSMNVRRVFHQGTTLTSGEIMVVGGTNETEDSFKTAEIYNPTTEVWTLTDSMVSDDRFRHALTRLFSGRVLVTAGKKSNVRFLASTELFDPSTNSWEAVPSVQEGGNGACLVTLQNGQALFAGGFSHNSSAGYHAVEVTQLFDENLGLWLMADPLAQARTLHTCLVLTNGDVLAVGGMNAQGVGLSSVERFALP